MSSFFDRNVWDESPTGTLVLADIMFPFARKGGGVTKVIRDVGQRRAGRLKFRKRNRFGKVMSLFYRRNPCCQPKNNSDHPIRASGLKRRLVAQKRNCLKNFRHGESCRLRDMDSPRFREEVSCALPIHCIWKFQKGSRSALSDKDALSIGNRCLGKALP
jgi:hypothetical protein